MLRFAFDPVSQIKRKTLWTLVDQIESKMQWRNRCGRSACTRLARPDRAARERKALWGFVRTVRFSRRHFQLLPFWVIAMFTLSTMVFWGALRMRVPVEPLVLLYAGAGIADLIWRVRVRRAGQALITSTRR